MTSASQLLHASEASLDEDLLLTDFTSNSSDFGWFVVNDSVMGGRSEGTFEQSEGGLFFSGSTNTNGGGFSSIRTKPLQLDLSEKTGIQLHVRGDGRTYTWRLTSSAQWRGNQVSYWASFKTDKNSLSVVNIPFDSFVPRYRGYQLDGPELDPGEITGMGLMIYDNQDGPFELQLASTHAYSAKAPFSLEQFQWKNRLLIVSATDSKDENFIAQHSELASSLTAFEERDLILITLTDNAVPTSANRALTSDEVSAMRDSLDISPGSFSAVLVGKDGLVKLARKSTVPMNEIYALIDTMPMRRNEELERQ